MRVKSILLNNFMILGLARLELPETGVVVLHGANGAGKSRFLEAVNFARSGKTIRRETPWLSAAENGFVEVQLEFKGHSCTINRGKSRLKVAYSGQTEWGDTNTKTQEFLNSLLGDHTVWQRSHCFSSTDSASFALASDAERKNFIEKALNFELFDKAANRADAALGAVTETLRVKQVALNELAKNLAVQEARLERLRAEYTSCVFEPGIFTLVEPPVVQAEQLDYLNKKLIAARSEAVTQPVHNSVLIMGLSGRLQELCQKQALVAAGKCPSCAQTVCYPDQDTFSEKISSLKEEINKLETLDKAADAEFWAEKKRRAVVADDIAGQLAELRAQDNAHKLFTAAYQKYLANEQLREQQFIDKVKRLKHVLSEESALAAKLSFEHLVLQSDVDELELQKFEIDMSARVLKSTRALVLTKFLSSLEHQSNYWLSLIGTEFKISLASQTSASGKTVEKIILSVTGKNFKNLPYEALSGGQRRRVDVALLLALAEVASSAAGIANGTLFLDEVFDALDEEGQTEVCYLLKELSKNRAVVVITHSELLASKIPATHRWRVVSGKLE